MCDILDEMRNEARDEAALKLTMGIRKLIAAAFTACIVLTFVPTISNADYTGWYLGRYGWMYYTVEDGFITESWKQINGVWYYFSSYGYMVHDATGLEIDGRAYDFDSKGKCLNTQGRSIVKSGWYKKCEFGVSTSYSWEYYDSNIYYVSGWHKIDGKWYYFDNGSIYQDSKFKINGKEYYFDRNGALMTGWIKNPIENKWMYADADGSIVKEKWLCKNGKWYYFNYYGYMVENVRNCLLNDRYYNFDSDGVCTNPYSNVQTVKNDWSCICDFDIPHWRCHDKDGKLYSGWHRINNKWVYFTDFYPNVTVNGKYKIGSDSYYFNENGEMRTGWIFVPNYYHTQTDVWYYAKSDGRLCCDEWMKIDGNWYYFSDFRMVCDVNNYLIDGIKYRFSPSGVCLNPYETSGNRVPSGWCATGGYKQFNDKKLYEWKYYDANGTMYKDKWLKEGSNWYYFDNKGVMVTAYTDYLIDGKLYDFNDYGVCMNPNNPRKD